MTMNAATFRASEDPGRLWFAVSVGPAAWTAHLLLSYFVVSTGCPLGAAAVKAILFAISAAFAAMAAMGALAAWRTWREWSDDEPAPRDKHRRRVAFMAFGGVVLSGYFLAAIVIESIPILMLDVCE